MQHVGRALGGAGSAGGSRDAEAPEPGVGMHRSVYERAFGALSDLGLDHARLPTPWPQHGDLLDEHEHEELLYRRQMALAAQDRARSVPPPVCAWTWRASRRARRTGALCRGTKCLREPVAPVLTAGRHAQVRVVHGANGRRQQAVPPHALGLRDAPDGRVRLPEPVLASAPAFPARPGPRASERACVCGSRR